MERDEVLLYAIEFATWFLGIAHKHKGCKLVILERDRQIGVLCALHGLEKGPTLD